MSGSNDSFEFAMSLLAVFSALLITGDRLT